MTLNLEIKNKTKNAPNERLVYENFRLLGLIKEDVYYIKKEYWREKYIELKNKFLKLKKSDYYNWSLFDNERCSLQKEYYSEFPSVPLIIYNQNSQFRQIGDIMNDLVNQPDIYKSV